MAVKLGANAVRAAANFLLLLGPLVAAGSAPPVGPPEPVAAAPPAPAASAGSAPPPVGLARTPEERAAELDQELAGSLAEFDGLLLGERNEIASQRTDGGLQGPEAGGGGKGSGQGKVGELGAGGDEQGARGEPGGNGEQGQEGKPGQQGEPGQPGQQAGKGEQGDKAEQGEQMGGGGDGADRSSTTRPAVPPDVGDGRDDDIVARQIREAAEKETDPELRDRLWQEYRDYKASLGKEGTGTGSRE